MAYYKVRIEVWCDWNPAESDLEDIAQSMGVGETICTMREVVAVVNRPQDIEDEEAMSFFGDQRAMPMKVRGRLVVQKRRGRLQVRWGGLCGAAEACVYAESPLIQQPFRNVDPISISLAPTPKSV